MDSIPKADWFRDGEPIITADDLKAIENVEKLYMNTGYVDVTPELLTGLMSGLKNTAHLTRFVVEDGLPDDAEFSSAELIGEHNGTEGSTFIRIHFSSSHVEQGQGFDPQVSVTRN